MPGPAVPLFRMPHAVSPASDDHHDAVLVKLASQSVAHLTSPVHDRVVAEPWAGVQHFERARFCEASGLVEGSDRHLTGLHGLDTGGDLGWHSNGRYGCPCESAEEPASSARPPDAVGR